MTYSRVGMQNYTLMKRDSYLRRYTNDLFHIVVCAESDRCAHLVVRNGCDLYDCETYLMRSEIRFSALIIYSFRLIGLFSKERSVTAREVLTDCWS